MLVFHATLVQAINMVRSRFRGIEGIHQTFHARFLAAICPWNAASSVPPACPLRMNEYGRAKPGMVLRRKAFCMLVGHHPLACSIRFGRNGAAASADAQHSIFVHRHDTGMDVGFFANRRGVAEALCDVLDGASPTNRAPSLAESRAPPATDDVAVASARKADRRRWRCR